MKIAATLLSQLHSVKAVDIVPEKVPNDVYDRFICIRGLSFHPILLEHIKSFNASIKSTLYLWVSDRYND